jgi:hypothetical protein
LGDGIPVRTRAASKQRAIMLLIRKSCPDDLPRTVSKKNRIKEKIASMPAKINTVGTTSRPAASERPARNEGTITGINVSGSRKSNLDVPRFSIAIKRNRQNREVKNTSAIWWSATPNDEA